MGRVPFLYTMPSPVSFLALSYSWWLWRALVIAVFELASILGTFTGDSNDPWETLLQDPMVSYLIVYTVLRTSTGVRTRPELYSTYYTALYRTPFLYTRKSVTVERYLCIEIYR